jgi:hypothetical protein
MSKKKPRPDGYWPNWENVERELREIIRETEKFPTQKELANMGKSSLAHAMAKYHGGMNAAKEKLGFEITKRNRGHYENWDVVVSELDGIWEKHPELEGNLPGAKWMRENGYNALAIGICRKQEGFRKVREKLGQKQVLDNPHGHYKSRDNLDIAIEDIFEKHPELEGKLPGSGWFFKNKYSTIANSIYAHHGGFREYRDSLGQKQIYKFSHGELKDWKKLKDEIDKMLENNSDLDGKLPAVKWMRENGYITLANSIKKWHGGFPETRMRLGQEELKREHGYWQDFENIKRELEQIISEQGKVPSKKDLGKIGYGGMATTIVKYHGGYSSVLERIGFSGEEIPGNKFRKFGDPFKFYQENYPGMSREELRKEDQSFYNKLCREDLLHLVPLKKDLENNSEELENLLDDYIANGGSEDE